MTGSRRWVWVTGRDYYEDERGRDRRSLQEGAVGSWSCHEETRKGDLVLLYRKAPRMDVAALLQATSRSEKGRSWPFECRYKVLTAFRRPLAFQLMKKDRLLTEVWSALRQRFQGTAFEIPPLAWERLMRIIALVDGEATGLRIAKAEGIRAAL